MGRKKVPKEGETDTAETEIGFGVGWGGVGADSPQLLLDFLRQVPETVYLQSTR